MKILITGGCGFIGSNFVRYWSNKHRCDHISVIDDLTYAGHFSSIDNVDCEFFKINILDSKAVTKVMNGADYVVHFAAESHVDRSILGPKLFLETNILGTQVLLDAALQLGVKRFHHVSTDEVFGSLSLSTNKKFNENTCYNPHSPYAASKASSDHLVRAYADTYGLDVTITNSSNNYGPYQSPEKFLPRMITNLIDDEPLPIYGDGKYVRDWIYVKDHCAAIEKVLLKGEKRKTYLVGGMDKDINNLEIAKTLLKIFNKDLSYLRFVKDRPGHDRRYAVDWRTIKEELGWEPKYDFESQLIKTVNWYKRNQWWWRPLKEESERIYERTNQK